MANRQAAAARRPAKTSAVKPPALEWIVAGLGLVFVLTSLTLIIGDALRQGGPAPAVEVQVQGIDATSAGWLVQFEAYNPAGDAAADVQVTGAVSAQGQAVERRSVVLDYVPGGGRARGGLLFRHDPRGALELAAEGYREP